MENSDIMVYLIGFVAQCLFAARLFIQWIRSEQSGQVRSPAIFWKLSIIASLLLTVYGMLRDDPVIVFGQVLTYFVYVRNLQYQGSWRCFSTYFRGMIVVSSLVPTGWLLLKLNYDLTYFADHARIPLPILLWGSAGQFVFTLRFVYQWYYLEKRKESVLPVGFWIISLGGSLMILSYAVYRLDVVLFVGQFFGLIIYARNVILSATAQELPTTAV